METSRPARNSRAWTTAAVIAACTAVVVAIGSCQAAQAPPSNPPARAGGAVIKALQGEPASTPAKTGTTPAEIPSVPVDEAPKPKRASLPKRVSDAEVEALARRWAEAWTALEADSDQNADAALADLSETIAPEFEEELGLAKLPIRTPAARVVDIKVLRLPKKGRWMAVVHAVRGGASEYLQPDIRRSDGRLLVFGLSD